MSETAVHVAGLRTLVVEPKDAPRFVVVILHGYAMLPEDLAPFAHSIGVRARFFIPEGPLEAESEGRAWWPIDVVARARAMAHGPRDLANEHPAGARQARERLMAFLETVRSTSDSLPIVLAGFSQGGMLACDAMLREPCPVAALALLSSSRMAQDEWLPLTNRLQGVPVFVSHGTQDLDLAFSAGEALRDFLSGAGANVTWIPFDGGHVIPLPVWRAFKRFLHASVPIS